MDIRFLVPGNVRHGSGGNKYNARLSEHLTALGADVEMVTVDGDWPVGSQTDRRRFADALDAGTTVIADGLVASGAPEEVAGAVSTGTRVWILSHMALADHPDREARAFAAATGVICPSEHAASRLAKQHGTRNIVVARPGVDQVEAAVGSEPPHLVVVAALLPNKDQELLVNALAELRELPWTAALIGTEHADPAYAAKVRAAVEHHGLHRRITLTGELAGNTLEQQWSAADLSILVSRSEAFGMVVTESLAHGVPVIVRQGTGAVEALGTAGAGAVWDPDDALSNTLRMWLSDPSLRKSWRAAARKARDQLPGWETTAATVLTAIAAAAG
ncbi:glycosyltransferase family 4 protein [Paenarthrobacter sp. NPDC089322]|uniref:glycosyltransferase family 4 protein n=1 Tax=Paenarthrobacter sp. NPDC089322 TaxID=3155065 RepID=UPI003436D9A3